MICPSRLCMKMSSFLFVRTWAMPHILYLKGESKKTLPNLRNSVCLISLATNMIDSWDIIHMKNEIHSSVRSTKTFLYDIRELSYMQNNIGYQISRISNNEQSNIFKSDTVAIYLPAQPSSIQLQLSWLGWDSIITKCLPPQPNPTQPTPPGIVLNYSSSGLKLCE